MGVKGPENLFRSHLCRAIQAAYGRKLYFQKHHGSAYSSGLADMLFTYKGETVQVELKAYADKWMREPGVRQVLWNFGKDPTAIQRDTLVRIHLAGGNMAVLVYVVPLKLIVTVHQGLAVEWMTTNKELTVGELLAWIEVGPHGWPEGLGLWRWSSGGPLGGWSLASMLFGKWTTP